MKKISFNWLWLVLLPAFNAWAADGDVWLEPATTTVAANTAFGLKLRVDSGTNKLGAYGVKVVFDPTLLQVDTSTTTSAITNGTNALSNKVYNADMPGELNIAGVEAMGVGPGIDLHPLTINFKSLAIEGTATVELVVRDLTTQGGYTIGDATPRDGFGSTITIGSIVRYTVTPSAGTGGTVSPSTAQTVTSGATKSFTVTPNTGYTKNSFVGGTCAQGSWNGNVWTTGAITANCTVTFSFTPNISAPIATTNAATNIAATSATLNGSVTSNGATATVSFDFGSTAAYDTSVVATPSSVYSSSAVAVTANKTGLTCGTAYHYCIRATNSIGSTTGLDKIFTTIACLPQPINGVCGSSNNNSFNTAPSTNLCSVGTNSAVSGTGPWNWSCAGTNGGSNASCTANINRYTATATAGTGGTVNSSNATVNYGTKASFTVTANSGYTRNNAVGGTCPAGTWSGNVWSTGAIVASCNVSFSFTPIVNGVCGTANGGTFSTAPAANLLCSTGNASAVTGTGPWNWSCAGSNGGTNASCSANVSGPTQYTVTPTVGANGTISPNTPQLVDPGAKAIFTLAPNDNYTKNSTVGGTCPQGRWDEYRWTTGTITGNCTVSFSFVEKPVAWLNPSNPVINVGGALVLDLHVDSKGNKVGTYNFTITFDPTKLSVDLAFAGTGCSNGVCPGADTPDSANAIVDYVGGKIILNGFDAQGIEPGYNLQLAKIHFKMRATVVITPIGLTLNQLITPGFGDPIGNSLANSALVNIQQYKCGDANGDTNINIIDALAIAREVIGLPPPPFVTKAADVNGNGETTIIDAMHLARYSVGLLVVGTCLI